jgi:hypothetical protein
MFKTGIRLLVERLSPKPADYRPRPKESIDYDALHADVAKRYPKIMKRLGE